MASFQAKIGQKWPRYRENKIIVPFHSYLTRNKKFQKKKAKKLKKLKNSVMASFQANIGRKRPGKRENKNYRFVLFLPGA